MSQRMVTLTTFANPVQAEIVKNHLVEEGIHAFLLGQEGGALFGGFGGPFGVVQIQVPEDELERAAALLEHTEDDPLPEDEDAEEPSTDIKAKDWTERESREEKTKSNDIQAPGAIRSRATPPPVDMPLTEREESGKDETEDDDELEVAYGPDYYAKRGLLAAVIGLLALPPLLHIYSLFLIMQTGNTPGKQLSPVGRRMKWAAILIDTLVFGFFCLLCSGNFRR